MAISSLRFFVVTIAIASGGFARAETQTDGAPRDESTAHHGYIELGEIRNADRNSSNDAATLAGGLFVHDALWVRASIALGTATNGLSGYLGRYYAARIGVEEHGDVWREYIQLVFGVDVGVRHHDPGTMADPGTTADAMARIDLAIGTRHVRARIGCGFAYTTDLSPEIDVHGGLAYAW
jgi:hypothetical protein